MITMQMSCPNSFKPRGIAMNVMTHRVVCGKNPGHKVVPIPLPGFNS